MTAALNQRSNWIQVIVLFSVICDTQDDFGKSKVSLFIFSVFKISLNVKKQVVQFDDRLVDNWRKILWLV